MADKNMTVQLKNRKFVLMQCVMRNLQQFMLQILHILRK